MKHYYKVLLDAKTILSECNTTWVKVYKYPKQLWFLRHPCLCHLIHYKITNEERV